MSEYPRCWSAVDAAVSTPTPVSHEADTSRHGDWNIGSLTFSLWKASPGPAYLCGRGGRVEVDFGHTQLQAFNVSCSCDQTAFLCDFIRTGPQHREPKGVEARSNRVWDGKRAGSGKGPGLRGGLVHGPASLAFPRSGQTLGNLETHRSLIDLFSCRFSINLFVISTAGTEPRDQGRHKRLPGEHQIHKRPTFFCVSSSFIPTNHSHSSISSSLKASYHNNQHNLQCIPLPTPLLSPAPPLARRRNTNLRRHPRPTTPTSRPARALATALPNAAIAAGAAPTPPTALSGKHSVSDVNSHPPPLLSIVLSPTIIVLLLLSCFQLFPVIL